MQVVRNLIVSYDIINSSDAQGNTALHVASYKGYLPVVEILVGASPSLALLTNHYGDTFLHMTVAGFRSHGFCRLDKHTELVTRLIRKQIVNLKDIINVKNNDGRTALHVAVIYNIQRIENENSSDANYDEASVESNLCSSEINNHESSNSLYNTKSTPRSYAASSLKFLLLWPIMRKETKAAASENEDGDPVYSSRRRKHFKNSSLRQRHSKPCSLRNDKYFTAG
ncbi:unnamed protein product [Lupinus luteus]|uniref:Uncharacterized protein n=1 Tax=Lupinus luteus TaxID=3873 RepID=A0AAV1WBI7_LUPLU